MDKNSAVKADSLMKNDFLNELLAILQDNGKDKDSSELDDLLNHVKYLEDFVAKAESNIANMKSQLDTMKEIQDHPIKHALQNTIKALETKVAEIKVHIGELKANIVEGCKNALDSFKEKGINALDKISSFFRIKSGLQAIKNDALISVDKCDKAVANIETFSKNYHTAGRSLKNMARMAVGKKPVDVVKESGKLAAAVSAPYKAQKAIQNGICKRVNKMINSLDKLELKAENSRSKRATEKSEKPSLLAALEANEKKSKEQFSQKNEPGKDTPKKSKNEAEV